MPTCEEIASQYGDILREYGTPGEELTLGEVRELSNDYSDGNLDLTLGEVRTIVDDFYTPGCVVPEGGTGTAGDVGVVDVSAENPEPGVVIAQVSISNSTVDTATPEYRVTISGEEVYQAAVRVPISDGSIHTERVRIEDVAAGRDRDVCADVVAA